MTEHKFINITMIVGKCIFIDEPQKLVVVETRFPKQKGGEIVHKHAIQVSESHLSDMQVGERYFVRGRLLTLNDDNGREVETIVEAIEVKEPPEAFEQRDYARAKIQGVLIRPAEAFDRDPVRKNKPFTNLRLNIGKAFVWVKGWSGLYRHFKSEATMGSVVLMEGNLGYQHIGEDGRIKITEVTGFNTEKSRVVMKAAVVDDFAGLEDEGEAIDFSATMPSPIGRPAAATAGPTEDDIPF